MIVVTTLLAAMLTVAPAGVQLDKDADGVVYSRHLAFRIPLNLTDQDRERCKAIRLFVSQDQGKTWVRHSDGSPDMKLVTFRAKQDGDFWFTLAIVMEDGTQQPDDIRTVEPGLKVTVDTTPPKMTLKPVRNTAGKRGVRWEVEEEHVDLLSLRVALWKQGDADWQLEPVRHPENQLIWFGEDDNVQKIQAMIRDRAGNEVVQQVDIFGDRFAKKTPERFAIENPDAELHMASNDAPATSSEPFGMTSSEPVRRVAHSSPISDSTSLEGSTPPPLAALPKSMQNEPAKGFSLPPAPLSKAVAGDDEPADPGIQPTLCRSDSLVINYALDEGQKDAVVELWGTQDGGKTWTMLAVDTDGVSPVEAKLQKPGVWGLLVRVPESPTGSGVAPEPGTKPDTFVELDMEAPQVAVEPPTMEEGKVVVHWRATDRNLEKNPVTILHATSHAGPWTPIAEQLPNTGSYAWTPTDTSEAMHYFRVDVKDRAGNVGKGVTRTPAQMASRPKSRVVTIESTQ